MVDFTIQMRVIHYAVVSPFNGSWNYALASVSSYKASDSYDNISEIFIFGTEITAKLADKSSYIIIHFRN